MMLNYTYITIYIQFILLCCICGGCSCGDKEQQGPAHDIINIPDVNFKTYLISNFDINNDGDISIDEASKIMDISYGCQYNRDIKSLEGIQYFVNLRKATHAFDGCSSLEYVPDLCFQIDNSEDEPADFSFMFLDCNSLKKLGILAFKGPGWFNATQMFGPVASLESVELLDIEAQPIDNGVYFMFGIYGSNITIINKVALSKNDTDYYGLFWSLPKLRSATFIGECKPRNICMHAQNELSVESFKSLFESLLPVSDSRGIRLGDYNKSRIPDDVMSIAINKGYQFDEF